MLLFIAATQILESCTDGSVSVRLEVVYALSKFFVLPAHIDCIKVVARAVNKRNAERIRQKTSLPSSPSVGAGESAFSKVNLQYPWHLSLPESKEITELVAKYLESTTTAASLNRDEVVPITENPIFSPSNPNQSGKPFPIKSLNANEDSDSAIAAKLQNPASEDMPGGISMSVLMASGYVRLWLALIEVQCKEQYALITEAAAAIRRKIHSLLDSDEERQGTTLLVKAQSGIDLNQTLASTPESNPVSLSPPNNLQSADIANLYGNPPSPQLRITSNRTSARQPSPSARNRANMKQSNNSNGSKMPRSGGFGLPLNLSPGSPQSIPHNQSGDESMNSGQGSSGSNDWGFMGEAAKAPKAGEAYNLTPFASNFYIHCRNVFIEPKLDYNPLEDPLSDEAKIQYYHDVKLGEVNRISAAPCALSFLHISLFFQVLNFESNLSLVFKDLDEMNTDDISALSPSSQSKAALASLAFPGLTKFEEKLHFPVDNPNIIMHVMFHAYHDILALSDGFSVGIWNTNTCSKIMEIKNKHTLPPPPTLPSGNNYQSGDPSGGVLRLGSSGSNISGTLAGNVQSRSPTSEVYTPLSTARITAMKWINEAYDSLLMLGSDDGSVKVWRDVACSTDVQSTTAGQSSSSSGVELVTSFSALPDVAEISRG